MRYTNPMPGYGFLDRFDCRFVLNTHAAPPKGLSRPPCSLLWVHGKVGRDGRYPPRDHRADLAHNLGQKIWLPSLDTFRTSAAQSGPLIEPADVHCFQSDSSAPPTLVQDGRAVWTRLELRQGNPR